MPRLLVILGSTRPGRNGLPIATWFTDLATADGRFDVELVDLAALALPLLDEPEHPRKRAYTGDKAIGWSRTVDTADAVVLVTPEYNFGYPAPLKNALDFLFHEWQHKPVGFVSYGGVAAGTRAVQQLKQVTGALQLVAAATAVQIPFVMTRVADGRFEHDDVMDQAAGAMLAELEALGGVLAPLRATR